MVASYRAFASTINSVSGSGWAFCLVLKLRFFLFAVIKIIANVNGKLFLFLVGNYKKPRVMVKAYKNIVGVLTKILRSLTKTVDKFTKIPGSFTKTVDKFTKTLGRLTNNLEEVFKTMKVPTEIVYMCSNYIK